MSDSVSGNAGQTLAAAPLLARLRDPDIFVDAVDEACELIERQEWEIRRLLQAIAICQAESEVMWSKVNILTPEHQTRLARISDASTNALRRANKWHNDGTHAPRKEKL